MARILITGSADGLGSAAAATLLDQGHEVVVHLRHRDRMAAVQDLLAGPARLVIGDLADAGQTHDLAAQANALGPLDAVIHNAGVYTGPAIAQVNVLAPYLLTALIAPP
ncbi:SDR family NAD(P)-dependent oxidoreductase [Rubrivivax gelatinosus]|uniref:SDR family NAD(P)-dependent oxidoreductase n=1 Tax=Rubrivivax gelatinosus TaxID=28068 RepID=UPI0003086586|nr:SDR family NAD(P)-dependent oxidoreductase [Rubrivivax gelatinosus]MBG6078482.1 nucleoside-diphosphate-sugar epimerase [Rubrivivax gelatinosus]